MGDGTNVVAAGQQFLTLLGSIFAAFFLLSLAVETILENFRGFLAIFGITWLKSKKTLQEGINEVADLVSGDQKRSRPVSGASHIRREDIHRRWQCDRKDQ